MRKTRKAKINQQFNLLRNSVKKFKFGAFAAKNVRKPKNNLVGAFDVYVDNIWR